MYRIPNADGDINSAVIFDSVTNVPTIHASTNLNFVGGTPQYTATFTAPNTTNACTGILLYINSTGGSGLLTVTLQENGVDTAAVVTFTLPVTYAGCLYLRFATPYVFTATTAGYYRFKIVTANGLTGFLNADSGGTLPAFMATDDRLGALGATDDLLIPTVANTGTRTITVSGTPSFGSGTWTGAVNIDRVVGFGIHVLSGGLLVFDTTASVTMTLKGSIRVGHNGELRMGTAASPYPIAYVAKILFNENGTTGNYGLGVAINGKLTLQGSPKTSISLWKSTFVSGLGTAASPLVVADAVDWAVGDQIEILASSANSTNYNECETKYIITKNSSTSYVLSNTLGGAESALTYTHTNAYVLNLERNVVIGSTNSSYAWWLINDSTVAGNVNLDWVRFEYCGSSVSGKTAFYTTNGSNTTLAVDYCVLYGSQGESFYLGSSSLALTFTGNIVTHATGGARSVYFFSNANNKTLIDFFITNVAADGFVFGTCANAVLTRCVVVACAKAGTSNHAYLFGGIFHATLTSCEAHCVRGTGFRFDSSSADIYAANCLLGSKGKNGTDVGAAAVFFTALLENCALGSTNQTGISSSMTLGSLIAFQKFNQTANDHRFFMNGGSAQSTGTGLTDTNVRTANSLALRLAPANATTGFSYTFKIPARANTVVTVLGFIQKNAAFGTDDVTVDLYLPNSLTPDATYTMPDDTNWNIFALAANYTGTENLLATVIVTGKTATSSAYAYIDDIFNGTNVLTAMDVWDKGQPTPVMYEQLGDANAVWAVLKSTQTTAGTMGEHLKKALTLPMFVGLK